METAVGVQPPGMLSDIEGMESSVPRKIRVKDRRGMSLILDMELRSRYGSRASRTQLL